MNSLIKNIFGNQLFMSAFYKTISGLSMFIAIPILISYLGTMSYGVWVLVFTLFQWILLMDFGLSSVLKTKIPELKHQGNSSLTCSYIKATYLGCCKIAIGIFTLFVILFLLFDIRSLLNIDFSSSFVCKLFLLNVLFFCINFILNTHKALFISIHRGHFSEQSIAVNQFLFLFFLLIPLFFFTNLEIEKKLYLISFINGFVSLTVNFVYSYHFFKIEKINPFIADKLPKDHLKTIYKLGFKYMIIQIGTLFLFSSDNYILAYYFNPNIIVPYEIVTKYFQFPLMIIMAGMSPLWSIFSIKFLEKNKVWLYLSFKRFNFFYLLVLIGMLIFVVIAKPVMKLWISKDFIVPHFLLITIAIMTSLRIFTTFYSYFFNGIGHLKTYILLLIISVLLKIPLSYLFVKLDYGISSVALSSTLCLLIWSIVQPLEAHKIVSNLKNDEQTNIQ